MSELEKLPTEQTLTSEPHSSGYPPASTGHRAILFLVAGVIIILDYLSKRFIETWLPPNQSWAPVPALADFFRITHVSNTGAAFGIFPSASAIFTLIPVFVAAVIIVYNFGLPARNLLLRAALGLQLGGALGNFISRIRLGHVTDFLDFGPWPVFNLADTSIVSGVIILGWLMLQEQKTPEREESEPSGERPDHEGVEPRQSPIATLQPPPKNEQAS